MGESEVQANEEPQGEVRYCALKDLTSFEGPELRGKLLVLWALTTLKGIPLAGMGRYREGEGGESGDEIVWYLVPKCGCTVEEGEKVEVLLYLLSPPSLAAVKKEHAKFRREVGGIRDYIKVEPSELRSEGEVDEGKNPEGEGGEGKDLEGGGTAREGRNVVEYHSDFNYGEMQVVARGKIYLEAILNLATEGRDKIEEKVEVA